MKRTIKQVRDLRAAAIEKRNGIQSKATTESRSLTDEERGQLTEIRQSIEDYDQEEKDLLQDETFNARQATPVITETRNGEFSDKDKRDLAKFSLVRGLGQMAVNGGDASKLDGIEREVHDLAVKDARSNGIIIQGFAVPAFLGKEGRGQTATLQTTNPGDQGGVLVQTEVNPMIEALWQKSWIGEAGATRLAGLQGNQTFPVQKTKPAIQELTEIQEIAESEILFSEIDMVPARRGAAIPISKQLLLQSSIDIQNFVINQLRMGLDYKLNAEAIVTVLAAITSGNGNLLALGANGAAPTYANIVALEAMLDGFEATQGNLAYLINDKTAAKLKLTEMFAGTNGMPVLNGGKINDYKTVRSNIVPSNLTKGTAAGTASAIVFGNWSDLYVGFWGGADFIVDPYTKAKTGQVVIVTNMFWNTKVARVESFAGIKDALTA